MNNKSNCIPILFTFDDNLIDPAVVCICSLLENAGENTFYDIFIMHGSDSLEDSIISEIPKHYGNCRINFRRIRNEFVGAYEIRGISETAYYRMLSPEIITEYDKILYSDVDVIFREDLSKYYNIDIQGNCFGAVSTCAEFRLPLQKYLKDELKFDYSLGYYYSGNLVINLKVIRENGLCDEFRKLAKNKYKMQDMDIINIACRGMFYRMPPAFCLSTQTYNLFVYRKSELIGYYTNEEMDDALNHGIVHYNGAKPWKTWSHHCDLWWTYYRKSFIFDEKLYANFYNSKHEELDQLSLINRLKTVYRFFKVGRIHPTESLYCSRD